MTAGTWLAIALAGCACLLALLALVRRPVHGRHAMTMQLSLTLLRYDEGLGLLAAHTRRAHRWWDDVEPAEQHLIDRALSMWDLAAWYVATGRVERRAVLEVFRWNIVDLWERAYPYVLHRRVDQPTLWPSLTDLYLDAYDMSGGTRSPLPEPEAEPSEPGPRSVSPEAVEQAAVADAQVSLEAAASLEPQRRPPVAPERLEPLPHPAVRAADVGWADALREAGPVTAARPPLLLRARPIHHHAEIVTEEWGSGAVTRPARSKPAPVRRPPGLEVEQVIDLTDATSGARAQVLG
ncbi:MAG: hypothetical protein JJD92_06270 [Frankiaceae bacterium]|nr:hypothetical protein [Frankiaceae bacterium]